MGCDIHIYPEKYVDGKWITAEPFVPSEWWWDWIIDDLVENSSDDNYDALVSKFENMDKDEAIEKYGDNSRFIWSGPWDEDYKLHSRNYYWFAILANVRNYNDLTPIDDPRGLPADISEEVRKMADQWESDGHSHSWFTLRELLEYNFDEETVELKGYVSHRQFAQYLETGKADFFIGYISDSSIIVSNGEMKQKCMGIGTEFNGRKFPYITQVSWREPYSEAVGKEYIDRIMNKLKTYGEPDKVRIVFWFDN